MATEPEAKSVLTAAEIDELLGVAEISVVSDETIHNRDIEDLIDAFESQRAMVWRAWAERGGIAAVVAGLALCFGGRSISHVVSELSVAWGASLAVLAAFLVAQFYMRMRGEISIFRRSGLLLRRLRTEQLKPSVGPIPNERVELASLKRLDEPDVYAR